MKEHKKELMLIMYQEMFNNINRHILVIWESAGVLLASLVILGIGEDTFVSIDLAVALIILLCVWMNAHIVDASAWFNRNQAIISEIEARFEIGDELTGIKGLFGQKRKTNKTLRHFRIELLGSE